MAKKEMSKLKNRSVYKSVVCHVIIRMIFEFHYILNPHKQFENRVCVAPVRVKRFFINFTTGKRIVSYSRY